MEKRIRVAAKAIIIEENHLLCVVKKAKGQISYLLPGGGQQHSETLPNALRRECLEELGVAIAVEQVLFVREFIADNHYEKSHFQNFHQVEIMFRCVLKEALNHDFCARSKTLDVNQIGLAWMPLYSYLLAAFIHNSSFLILLKMPLPTPIYIGDID
ncbi:MAG: NUDIX domain-containing protein [Saprospiraceae bacterium]|nr:NUDIX domain-containing protein [Saprospiraceae bacterium]